MKKIAKISAMIFVMLACLIPVNAAGQWKKDSKGWWYDWGSGKYPKKTITEIDGRWYYFDESGYMKTGWQLTPATDAPSMYYFKNSGEMARSEWIGGSQWVNFFGEKQWNAWVDNGRYYVNSSGVWDPSKGTRKTGWKKDNKGWWFDTGNGSYAKNCFFEIDKKVYYFNGSGYMQKGWVKDSYDRWYYLGNDGVLRTNQWVGDYYVGYYGDMKINQWVDHDQYYVGPDGKWVPETGNPHWVKDSKGWWYDLGDGSYPKNGEHIIDGKNYFFGTDGYLKMGWFEIGGKWHYSDKKTGVIHKNRWVGDYWLDSNGIMATNRWVDGGRYYVGPDGKWIPGYQED